MTVQENRDYWDRPGSFSEDLDRIRARTTPIAHHAMSEGSKVIVMGKAKVLQKGPFGSHTYRVTFHETWTRIE